VEWKRAHENPLLRLKRQNEDEDRRRVRRAATEQELDAFIDAVRNTPRAAYYLTVIHTGLRRKESRLLLKGDVDLEAATMRLRSTVSKNGREDLLPLHPQVVEALRPLMTVQSKATEPLFAVVPRLRTFYRDLQRAGITPVDGEGRKLDFHALRMTLATRLIKQGVPLSKVSLITRHRSVRVLEKHYKDLRLGDARGVVDGVRAFGSPAPEVEMPAGKTTGNFSPNDAPDCTELHITREEPRVLRLIGPEGEVRYTAPLSSESLLVALARIKASPESAQVLILRAISAAG
jgi:hypothetical protein